MDPLSLTASLIAVAQVTVAIVDTCYKWKSAVRNSSKQASQIVQQLDSLRSILERLTEIVENESPGSSRLSALTSLSRKGGPLNTCAQGLNELQSQLQPKTGWKGIENAIVWPLKEDETRKAVQDLNDMKATLHFALDIDHTTLALQMDSGIKSLTSVTDSIKNDEYRSQIRAWIAAPDPFPNHNAARRKCQSSTGMWFINSRLFTQWLRGSNSMLWLHGIPGCGKSVLCSTTVERLYSITQQTPFVAVAYFYFDFQNSGSSTVEALVRSLIVQLFNQSHKIPSELELLRNQFKDNDNKPPLSKLIELLSLLVQHFQSTYFVIDALDECEEIDGLLSTLGEFQNWNFDIFHILVFSRQQLEIDEFMATAKVSTLCINDFSISDDINLYIKDQLHSRKFSKWAEDVRLEIYEVLSDGANGMFRWVACQLDMLRSSPTLKSLRRDLRSLPKSLEETYERILLRIPEEYRSYASRILAWLSFTVRPLSIAEVAEMLAMDLKNDPCYDMEDRLADPRDVLLMCSNLVTTSTASFLDIYEEMGFDKYSFFEVLDSDAETQWLRLSHLSVKDYLLSQRIKSSPASHFSVDTRIANEVIAQTCLAYLLLPAFRSGPCSGFSLGLRFREWPLLGYAIQSWSHHITASAPLGAETWALISKLFSTRSLPNGGNYAAWIEMLVPESPHAQKSPPLYYAASFGMYEVVERMLEENPDMDIDTKGGRYDSSALHVAVYRGHNRIAKLLINAGANVNDRNRLGESLLLWAYLRNTFDMRDILEQHGAIFSKIDMLDMAEGGRLRRAYVDAVHRGDSHLWSLPIPEPLEQCANYMPVYNGKKKRSPRSSDLGVMQDISLEDK